MASSAICGCRSLAWPKRHWCELDQEQSRQQARIVQASHWHTCCGVSHKLLAGVAASTALPTKVQEYVAPAKRGKRARSMIHQSCIGTSTVGDRSLTVYVIHKPTTIASNRGKVSPSLSKSPFIADCSVRARGDVHVGIARPGCCYTLHGPNISPSFLSAISTLRKPMYLSETRLLWHCGKRYAALYLPRMSSCTPQRLQPRNRGFEFGGDGFGKPRDQRSRTVARKKWYQFDPRSS